jgi:hypothetical protein
MYHIRVPCVQARNGPYVACFSHDDYEGQTTPIGMYGATLATAEASGDVVLCNMAITSMGRNGHWQPVASWRSMTGTGGHRKY